MAGPSYYSHPRLSPSSRSSSQRKSNARTATNLYTSQTLLIEEFAALNSLKLPPHTLTGRDSVQGLNSADGSELHVFLPPRGWELHERGSEANSVGLEVRRCGNNLFVRCGWHLYSISLDRLFSLYVNIVSLNWYVYHSLFPSDRSDKLNQHALE